MTSPSWRATVERWGDQLWALALLGTGDPVAAQHALVQAFGRVFGAATPATDTRTSLLQALVPRRRHHWLPHVARHRALPRALRRINPADRVLLALWLAHEHDGAQLARVAQVAPAAIVPRLVPVLLPFLPRSDIARRTPAGRTTFAHWVGRQLGIGAALLPDTFPEDTTMGWQQAVEHVRDLLAQVTTQQRLPPSCRDAIEAALTVQADETPAWQLRARWLTLSLLVVLAIGWILRPTFPSTAASSTADPQSANARTVVQAAIDGWTTMPIAGTLHRRVWALDPRRAPANQALVTDVWLPSAGAQYRVETTHDGTLVEWHVVDGSGRLHTAADPLDNMCHAAYGPNVWLDRRALDLDVPADQVRAVRDARLRSGTYGQGYRMLQRALHAPDLRSYGVRTENARVLRTLGFRDTAPTPARTVLVEIDARTNELHAVRAHASDAGQSTVHDLWRVDAHETVATVPTALPLWDAGTQRRSDVLDPACPDLPRSSVVSVRAIAATSGLDPSREWGAKYAPVPLPGYVTQAAFIGTGPREDPNGGHDPSFANLVLRSADGWLHLSMSLKYPVPTADALRRGDWLVRVNSENGATDALDATLWRQSDDVPEAFGVFDVTASGWTRDQLVEVVARLQPVNARTWPTLAPQFLDPQPLAAEVAPVVVGAQQALAALPDGTYHVRMDAIARSDPPAVGLLMSPVPSAWTVEQWATLRASVVVEFKQVVTAADGTLVSATLDTAAQSGWYEASTTSPSGNLAPHTGVNPYSPKPTLGIDLMRPLLELDAPITLTADEAGWRFEQVLPAVEGYFFGRSLELQNQAWAELGTRAAADELPGGDVVQRVAVDRPHLLPQRWELVHRSPDGDIVLNRITVRDWRRLDASLPDGFWALPPLPSDTEVLGQPAAAPDSVTVTYTVAPSELYTTMTYDTSSGPQTDVIFTDCLTTNQTYTLDFAVAVATDHPITARIVTGVDPSRDVTLQGMTPATIKASGTGIDTIPVRGTFRTGPREIPDPQPQRRDPLGLGIALEGPDGAQIGSGTLSVGFWCIAAPMTRSPGTGPADGSGSAALSALAATVTYQVPLSDLYTAQSTSSFSSMREYENRRDEGIIFQKCLTANQTYTLDFTVVVTTDRSVTTTLGMRTSASDRSDITLIPLGFTPATIQTTGTGTDRVKVRAAFRAGNNFPTGRRSVLISLDGPDGAVLGEQLLVTYPCVNPPVTSPSLPATRVTSSVAASDLYTRYDNGKEPGIYFNDCLTANQTYTLDFTVAVTTDRRVTATLGTLGQSSNVIPLDFTPATIQTTGTGTDTVTVRGTFRAGTTIIPRDSSEGLAINLLGIYLLEGPDKAVLGDTVLVVGYPCVAAP